MKTRKKKKKNKKKKKKNKNTSNNNDQSNSLLEGDKTTSSSHLASVSTPIKGEDPYKKVNTSTSVNNNLNKELNKDNDKNKLVNLQAKIDTEIEEFEQKLDLVNRECVKKQKIRPNLSDDWVLQLRQRIQKRMAKMKV